MFQLLRIPRKELFSSNEARFFPSTVSVLTQINRQESEVDIVIGTFNQAALVNLVIENFLKMEQKAKTHLWVIEGSHNLANFLRIKSLPQVSKVMLLTRPEITMPNDATSIWASYAAGYSAQVGHYLGAAPYIFFSHSDMLACKENFLTFLLSKVDAGRPIATFTQRGAVPFTGGMLYRRAVFEELKVDWLPKEHNPYTRKLFGKLGEKMNLLNWIDTGEELIYKSLNSGKRVYVCASRGSTGDFWGHALDRYAMTNAEIRQFGINIDYANLITTRQDFARKHPSLASPQYEMWRKCFDDQGDLIFLHRGRGTTSRGKDHRGDFRSFSKKFIDEL